MLLRFSLLFLAAIIASGQHRLSIRTGDLRVSSGPPAFSTGLPPVGGIPPFGVQRSLRRHTLGLPGGFPQPFAFPQRRVFHSVAAPFGLPLSFGTLEPYPSMPPLIIVLQQPATAPPKAEPPAEPIKPMIREYKFPERADDRGHTFSIVFADGSQHSAIAVWRQDDWLHYVTPAGAVRRVLVKAVDREATVLLNREKGLNLSW